MATMTKRKTAISAKKQADSFSTPKGGAVAIRKNNVSKAVNTGSSTVKTAAPQMAMKRELTRNSRAQRMKKTKTRIGG